MLALVLISGACASLLFAPAAPAAAKAHPTVGGQVCVRETFWTKPLPANRLAYFQFFVNNHELVGTMAASWTIEWHARGVTARIDQRPRGTHPVLLRVASIRDDCARVRLMYWLAARPKPKPAPRPPWIRKAGYEKREAA